MGEWKASFQMVLPLSPLLAEVAGTIEQTASQAGLLMMKALIDEEVEQIAGVRYGHQVDRQATRWGHDEGYVIFLAARWYCPDDAFGRREPLPSHPGIRAIAHPDQGIDRYR
jgi:hypothetical protein